MSARRVYCIDSLNTCVLLSCVLPRLCRDRLAGNCGDAQLWSVKTTPAALKILNVVSAFLRVKCLPWEFNILDAKDAQGDLLMLRVLCDDSNELHRHIAQDAAVKAVFSQDRPPFARLGAFVSKQTFVDRSQEHSYSRQLLLLQTFHWDLRRRGMDAVEKCAFISAGSLGQALSLYAKPLGIRIQGLPLLGMPLKNVVTRILGEHMPVYMYHFYRESGVPGVLKVMLQGGPPASVPANGPSKVLVEYYGQLNLDQPHLYSDFFFWPYSKIAAEDMCVAFNLAKDPLDKSKYDLLQKYGMQELVLHPDAVQVEGARSFYHWPRGFKLEGARLPAASASRRWVQHQYANYAHQFEYWQALFSRHKIGMYVSWFKYGSRHCVIADALQSVGGITAMYQRAMEGLSSVGTMTCADVFFGFSAQGAGLERGQGSRIPYYVIAGYNGDHRFALLRPHAQELRTRLMAHGAKKILAFFDENSYPGPWNPGHEFIRDNYAFLLDKVLKEPWFGLVLKPKVPSTLRRRLGNVAQLLSEAEATGRCIVCAEGNIGSAFPPALAALGADIAVHGHMFAATAGLEAALAGVPTLLLDREGWPRSHLYRLGKGQTVFNEWPHLWEACLSFWNKGHKIGDWSPLLNELDPFRDGNAAGRIGQYLTLLYAGLKAGRPRQQVLDDAAEEYVKKWGKDKIVAI